MTLSNSFHLSFVASVMMLVPLDTLWPRFFALEIEIKPRHDQRPAKTDDEKIYSNFEGSNDE